MTENKMTNQEALDAMEIFEDCQKKDLPFKLKYAMARNLERLKVVKKAFDNAKNIAGDPNCSDFLKARKAFLEAHQTEEGKARFDDDKKVFEKEHSETLKYLAEKEVEIAEWLKSPIEGLEIFKISIGSFPDETSIDIGKIFAFIAEE